MIITDNTTRYRLTLYLATKADASLILQKFAQEIHQKIGCQPQEQRINRGTEFSTFTKQAKSAPINITVTLLAPYTHKQNRVSEFSRFYLLQIARTIRIDASAPQELQPEAVNTATYIINRLRKPLSKREQGAYRDQLYQQAPIIAQRQSLNLRSPNNVSLSFLRAQYTKAYVYIPKEKRVQSQKIDTRAQIGHLVGYEGDNSHIYRIYDPKTKKVSRYRDVVFQEQKQGIPHYNKRDIITRGQTIDSPPIERSVSSLVIVTSKVQHLV